MLFLWSFRPESLHSNTMSGFPDDIPFFDEERARHWIEHGAQPSETVAHLLRTKGIAAHGS